MEIAAFRVILGMSCIERIYVIELDRARRWVLCIKFFWSTITTII